MTKVSDIIKINKTKVSDLTIRRPPVAKRHKKKGANIMTKLKGYRVMLGLTQRQMAEKLGISLQSYNNKETGKNAFNDRERFKIRDMVREIKPDITIDELFYS